MSKVFDKRSDGEPIPTHLNNAPSQTAQELPGQDNFLRGVQPTMYRGKFWTMRQYAGFGTADETNARFLQLLKAGQTGLSMAFDLPTQMGFDADEGMAQGEVGRVGVSISSLEDMQTVLRDIPLDTVSSSMTINSTAAILLSFYITAAKSNGISANQLRGTIQNDILKEYIARGTYIYPPAPSMRIVTDLIEYCAKNVPLWNPISISGYHIREAGSDAVQEIAFTLANACAYAEDCIQRGMAFDDFAGRLSFFFASHNDFIEEISKFRAARYLWAKIAKERFHAKDPRSCMLRFHAQTAGSTLTAQQPNNNLVRVTIQAMAAILGGCQSLHTNSRDEALSLPTQESAMLALRTQQILAEESGIANTIDPVGGSYLIETETQRLVEAAEKIIRQIDEIGGSVRAIEEQFFQKAIADRSYEYQQNIEKLERKIVGMNAFVASAESTEPAALLKVDPKLEAQQKTRLENFRKNRDQNKANAKLAHLSKAAEGQDNLVPHILEAVESHATLGEISHTLRKVFGLYQP